MLVKTLDFTFQQLRVKFSVSLEMYNGFAGNFVKRLAKEQRKTCTAVDIVSH